MFITNATYEFPFPDIPGDASARYFRAFDVATRRPWFLVTFRMVEDRVPFAHTVACASDRDLVQLLQTSTWELAALQQIVANRGGMLAWTIRDITRVWYSPESIAGVPAVRLECDDEVALDSPTTDQASVDWVLLATVRGARARRRSKR